MKKIILTIVCLFGVLGANAQTAKIALSHNGNLTLLDADQMTKALEQAVNGDTIYLNEGLFTGGFTINKQVSIIGAGENTFISSGLTIALPNTPTLKAHLLDALYIRGPITVQYAVDGLKIRKCAFDGITFSAEVKDALIDRCRCYYNQNYTGYKDFVISDNVKGLTVINSKIARIYGNAPTAGAANFVNCDIYYMINNDTRSSLCRATYLNSVIQGFSYSSNSSYCDATTTYVNCLFRYNNYTYSINQGCFQYSNNVLNESTLNCTLDEATLVNNKYLGTDGTIVGSGGGTTPYTLVPSTPKVTDYTIKVDPNTKKLNVNIKVSAN